MAGETPKTHVFVGMFRPTFDAICKVCRPYDMVRAWDPRYAVEVGSGGHREAWLRGLYDEPVYVTIEEALKHRQPAEPPPAPSGVVPAQ